jgi:NADH-quinone oxidoreductase subunit N
MGSYLLIVPELVVLAAAIAVLFADVLFRGNERAAAWLGAFGAAAAGVLAIVVGQGRIALFGDMFAVDALAQFGRASSALLAAVFLVWLAGAGLKRGGLSQFTSLALFATLGGMLMASAQDWVVLLLALETATMPAYVLMGFDRDRERSLEGALKYFLLSMVASLLFLYGLSFVIGTSGSTLFAKTHMASGAAGIVVTLFLIAGLLAKLSAAPFQWWSPDAYAGAPTPSVAFVSSVPKIAAVVAFSRLVQYVAPQVPSLWALLAVASVASLLIGNLAAYPQEDLKRLMGYSGVAHAGYLLVGLAAAARTVTSPAQGVAVGLTAAVFYALAYAVPSMAIMFVVDEHGHTLKGLAGLAKRRPWVAWVTVLLLVSLVGVPPLAGFVGKLYLFGAAVSAQLTWLALVALVMSVVSAGYYFRIVRTMFFDEPAEGLAEKPSSSVAAFALAACAVATVAIGIAASPLLASLGFSLS